MKKIIFIVALVIVGYSVSYSQSKTIKYYSTEVMDEIKATSEQRRRIADLVEKYNAVASEIKSNTNLSKEDKKEALKKATQERAAAYWNELTPEQIKYLKDKKKQLANAGQ